MKDEFETSSEQKVYVIAEVSFGTDGHMIPKAITWEDGHQYKIDKVLDRRPSYSAKAGGQGDRYTIRIAGQETFLFFEHNMEIDNPAPGRWFVERR